MSAIEIWNDIVLAYRKSSLNTGNHWQGEHAKWYDQWVKLNNYADEVYPIFQPFIRGRVLEIGAGTGLFTQYLVKDAQQLDVLEPSADMMNLLKRNVGNRGKISFFKTTIEQFDFQEKQYDFVFAAHAFFNVLHIDWVLRNILNHCSNLGVLIGNGKSLDVFQVFHNLGLVEKERARPPHYMNLIPVLEDCGYQYDICQLQTVTKHMYQTEKELIDKTAKQCAIRAEARTAYLEMIKPLIKRNEGGFYVQGYREHVCLLVGKEKVDFHNPAPAK